MPPDRDTPAAAITNVFAGLKVGDLATAQAWWERLLGRPPDLVPNAREAAWELAPSAWVYVVAAEDGGELEGTGDGVLTVLVDDLDAFVAGVAERGLAPEEEQVIPGAVRKTIFADPDGNAVVFGQPGA